MDLKRKRWYDFCHIKIFLLLCINGIVFSETICNPGLSMPGYTVPQGDILIEYGSPLDIMCVVVNTSTTNNETSLYFKRNSEIIPSEMIKVINSTAINLHIEKPPLASGDTYTCLLKNNTNVCMNRVTIGIKPQKVTDFKCISQNFDNLTCTWTGPQNYARTTYGLSFTLGEGRSARYPIFCPEIVENIHTSQYSCFWNVSTTPPYRPVHELYNFTLTMENPLGKNQINELFNHFAHVLSGPPENLTFLNTTSSSVFLFWEVPLSMQTFPKGVHHRILYQCEYGEKKWNYGGLLTVNAPRKYAYFNLTNLPYAHALCDIRVSLRSSKALYDDESMWSRNASITVRTNSKIPDVPPETNVGSFQIVSFGHSLESREAYIYWKQIQEIQKNGPRFKYRVALEGNDSVEPIELTNSYAKFKDLSISKSYTFHIWSENAEGLSLRKSTVRIPKQSDRVKEAVGFTKIALREEGGEFELTWEHPKLPHNEYITNYTIFKCMNDRDRPYQCTGFLDWKIISNESVSTNLTVPKHPVFQFAIAANTRSSSSGMFWAECTIIYNKNMGKMKNVWINRVGSTFIEVGWKLDCTDQIGSVKGYIVYYCPIISPSHTQCKAPQANSTFIGSGVLSGNITNLNPYTTYMLTVSVITKQTTLSQQSDPLFNTTLEDAPTPPQDLRVTDISNSSITVTWKPPAAMNGVLRYYLVELQGSVHTLHKIDQTQFTFTNLTSYENYSITVVGCSVQCSEKTKVSASTIMGYPSKIPKPTVDRRNDTSLTITWNKPSQPGGKNDYYVVRLKQKHKHGNETFEFNTTDHNYVVKNCGDGDKFNTFYVSVKAVNMIGEKVYAGPWSDELENYCYTPINYIMYLLLVIVVAILIVLGFLSTRLYHRYQIMKDVGVELPPGLAPVVADHTLVPWSAEKHQESRASHSTPDEELLLVKMSEARQFSGDSSGCSSGHESVTSSLETGTHISSSSDSGTEQPGNYCALGVINPKIEPSYIPVTVDPNKMPYKTYDSNDSSPYVMTGEAVKTMNPGYVPFNQTEPSSGYVVAGIKNGNGYIPFNQTDSVGRNTGYVVAGIKNCKLD